MPAPVDPAAHTDRGAGADADAPIEFAKAAQLVAAALERLIDGDPQCGLFTRRDDHLHVAAASPGAAAALTEYLAEHPIAVGEAGGVLGAAVEYDTPAVGPAAPAQSAAAALLEAHAITYVWAIPFLDTSGAIGLWFREPREPSDDDWAILRHAQHTCSQLLGPPHDETVVPREAFHSAIQRGAEDRLRDREATATRLRESVLPSLLAASWTLLDWPSDGIPAGFGEAADAASAAVSGSISDVAELLEELQPNDASTAITHAWRFVCEQRPNEASFTIDETGPARTLDANVGQAVNEAARELLDNAVRHANASEIKVAITWTEDHVNVAIADDGRGFKLLAALIDPQGHLGLLNAQAAVHAVNGTLYAVEAPTTVVSIRVPTPAPIRTSRAHAS